jgi:CheY-like chemotaxis protein/HPt (histidine-containing phosphotransfer) domain-containing protein
LVAAAGGQVAILPFPQKQTSVDAKLSEKYPLRILLAEDNAVNQRVAVRIFERLGYRVDVAANEMEVLDAMKVISYDVVFMDVHMPDMDGLEASRILNQQYTSEERPIIIAMTANAMMGDREICLAAGMDDYVSKPVRLEELQSIVAKWGAAIITRRPNIVEQLRSHKLNTTIVDEQKISFLNDLHDENDILFFLELIDIFIAEAPKTIEKIEEANKNNDAEQLAFFAHKLKGSSLALGLEPVAQLCGELEIDARAKNVVWDVEHINEIRVLFAAASQELLLLKKKYQKVIS